MLYHKDEAVSMKKKDHVKLTITLTPQTEHALRIYVSKTYPIEPFGKLSDTVEKAISQYLKGKV